MSSRYLAPLADPRPDSIYEFGAMYFANMLENPGTSGTEEAQNEVQNGDGQSGLEQMTHDAAAMDVAHLSAADLESVIMRLFLEADTDSSGYLDRKEFANVLHSAELNLGDRQIRQILAEADSNEDNVIEYKEFLPVMMEILQFIRVREQAESHMNRIETMVRSEVEDMLLHGLSKEELETLMQRVFQKADTDGSGALDQREFKECLKAAELGLTRKDINLIMSQVDTNQDGCVSYAEFLPVCFQVLVERFKDEIMVSDILSNHDGLQGVLIEAFKAADPDSTGLLSQSVVKHIFKDLSFQVLGLTTLQQISLISQAPTTPDGLVQYIQFVPPAAAMIFAMYDIDSMKLRMQAIREAADAGGMQALSNMDIAALRSLLETQFKAADVGGQGQLSLPQVMEILDNLGTLAPESMQLTDSHMRAMFTTIDANEDGAVDWTELINFICDVIEHIEREQYIAGRAAQAAS